MHDTDKIERLRRQLDDLDGPARIPTLIELANTLCQRWAAQPGAPQAERDITEATAYLREARGRLRRDDPLRAQISGQLGYVLVGRGFLESGLDGRGNPDGDEAIECLTEAVEHPDLPRANLEMALLYLAMALFVRALPPGSVAGLSIDGLVRAGPAALPRVLDYLRHASAPERLADLDRAEAYASRLRSMPPVNDQIHAMGSVLLDQIQLVRTFFGGGGASDLVTLLSRLSVLWPDQPSSPGPFGKPGGSGQFGNGLGFPGGPPLPGLKSLTELWNCAPPVVHPAVSAATLAGPPAEAQAAAKRARHGPAPRSEQVLIDIEHSDYLEVVAFAQARDVHVEVRGDGADEAEPGRPVSLLLRGPAAAVRATVDLIERRKGGHVLDLRAEDGTVAFRRRDLPHGHVLVLAADGEVRVEVHQPQQTLPGVIDAIVRMRSELIGLDGASVGDALERTVGDRATIVHRAGPG